MRRLVVLLALALTAGFAGGCRHTPMAPCPVDTLRLVAVRDDGRSDTLTAYTSSCVIPWPRADR